MRTSLNPLMYNTYSYSRLFEEAGTFELLLTPGTYYVAMCGGGGAGGSKGGNSSGGQTGGSGGAGGTATISENTIVVNNAQRAIITVGAGGLTKANGGNGGNGGVGLHPGGNGGGGGGGGYPTLITFAHPVMIADTPYTYLVSNGGGGGGGGGGANEGNRSAEGSGGGGGGGAYVLNDDLTIVSRAGKNGGAGGANYANGQNGVTGYGTDVTSGAGGRGFATRGGYAAQGYGASGGGGGGCQGNDDDGWRRPGGAGGGGAGGSATAGGGSGGTAYGNEYNAPGNNASNARTAPVKSFNYKGEQSTLGQGGIGQTTTQAATNGYNGWFFIIKFQPAGPLDLGGISDAVTNIIDCDSVTGTVEATLRMGQIA